MYIRDLFSTTAYTKKDATAAQLTLDQLVPVRFLLRQLLGISANGSKEDRAKMPGRLTASDQGAVRQITQKMALQANLVYLLGRASERTYSGMTSA